VAEAGNGLDLAAGERAARELEDERERGGDVDSAWGGGGG